MTTTPSSSNTTRRALAAIILLLVAAVVIDRTGVLRSSNTDPAEPSPSQRYASEAAALADMQTLTTQQTQAIAARDAARDAWSAVEQAAVTAETRPLAVAAFRTAILQTLNALSIQSPTATTPPASAQPTPLNTDRPTNVEPLRLTVRFDARSTDVAYTAITAIEQMTSPLTRVSAITITGPGANPAIQTLTIELTADTIAHITPTN